MLKVSFIWVNKWVGTTSCGLNYDEFETLPLFYFFFFSFVRCSILKFKFTSRSHILHVNYFIVKTTLYSSRLKFKIFWLKIKSTYYSSTIFYRLFYSFTRLRARNPRINHRSQWHLTLGKRSLASVGLRHEMRSHRSMSIHYQILLQFTFIRLFLKI